jgi:hypothetical protein
MSVLGVICGTKRIENLAEGMPACGNTKLLQSLLGLLYIAGVGHV